MANQCLVIIGYRMNNPRRNWNDRSTTKRKIMTMRVATTTTWVDSTSSWRLGQVTFFDSTIADCRNSFRRVNADMMIRAFFPSEAGFPALDHEAWQVRQDLNPQPP